MLTSDKSARCETQKHLLQFARVRSIDISVEPAAYSFYQSCARLHKNGKVYRWYVAGSVSIADEKKKTSDRFDPDTLYLCSKLIDRKDIRMQAHFITTDTFTRNPRETINATIISLESASRASIKDKVEFRRKETLRSKTTIRRKTSEIDSFEEGGRWKKICYRSEASITRFLVRAYGVETNSGSSRLASPGSPPNKEQRHFHN